MIVWPVSHCSHYHTEEIDAFSPGRGISGEDPRVWSIGQSTQKMIQLQSDMLLELRQSKNQWHG
jgi:hypothetical protein